MTILDSVDLGVTDGFTITAVTVPDDTAYESPEDVAEYADAEATAAAWRNDEWGYVGIVVIASRAGVKLGTASIWAVESGSMPGVGDVDPLRDKNGSLGYYGDDLTAEAVTEARRTLASLLQPSAPA
jgi:hypothetical protein